MFYVPTDIWMLIVPVAIIWLLIQMGKGLGRLADSESAIRKAASDIKILSCIGKTSLDGLSIVASAYRDVFTKKYMARVDCYEIDHSTWIEAKTEEELWKEIQVVFEDNKRLLENVFS